MALSKLLLLEHACCRRLGTACALSFAKPRSTEMKSAGWSVGLVLMFVLIAGLAQDRLALVATARSDSDLRAFLSEQKRRGRTEA